MSDRSIATHSTAVPATLRIVDPQSLSEQLSQTHENIARRAFELFESDGQSGRDLENWLRAEQELLHPVHVNIRESSDALIVDAEVPGFAADQLQVSLQPRQLTITGKKQSTRNEKTLYDEWCSSEILRVIELPVDVTASRAAATLKNGILELTLPKVAEVASTQVAAKAAGSAA